MTKETLFPERQRCKKCSKKLEAIVLKGLYCSYRCAGEAPPSKNVDDAPRWCKTEKAGQWAWKKRFRSVNELPLALRNDASSSSYWCSYCQYLHVGHTRIDVTETTRIIKTAGELADVLTKARGSATIREIAKASGLQPIRIKELEEAKTQKVELDSMFKLIAFYRLKLAVVFK